MEINYQDHEPIERFVIAMYDKSSSLLSVDKTRLDIFARKQRSYDNIPPTKAALIEHVKRAAYQAGFLWGQTLVCQMETVDPGNWDWRTWDIVWTKLEPIAKSCQQLTKCVCNTECRLRCTCYRLNVQ